MTYGGTDYGFRAKKAGFKVMFCPQTKLWHKIKMQDNIKTIRALRYNLPMRAYYFARNRIIFMKEHGTKVEFLDSYYMYKIIAFGGS